MRARLSMYALIAFISLGAGSAVAQNTGQPAEPGGSQIRMFDAWAQFPYPSWHKTENALAESQVSRQQHADTFVVAMIPKKDSGNG